MLIELFSPLRLEREQIKTFIVSEVSYFDDETYQQLLKVFTKVD